MSLHSDHTKDECIIWFKNEKTINLCRLELREPSFLSEKGVVQVFVNGKTVHLPVPSSVTDLDLTCELDAPACEPTLDWVYGWFYHII